jgi:hypothetical protein
MRTSAIWSIASRLDSADLAGALPSGRAPALTSRHCTRLTSLREAIHMGTVPASVIRCMRRR